MPADGENDPRQGGPSRDTIYCTRKGGGYSHFYHSRAAVRLCGAPEDQILHVRLVPDDEGTHWGWHDYEADRYCMVWPSLVQLKVCFTYGIEVEENRNKGIRARLRVEELPQ